MIAASIDIGTNTVLLLVADCDGQTLTILHDEARITRLGEGLHENPNFLPAAQERVLRVLKEYRATADALKATSIVAVGTAAFRKARNAGDFVARVHQETGIEVRIISGEEEARLSYLSVERDFGGTHKNLVAMDIGGGSTEIISRAGAVSLPLGAVVLSESIVHHDPPTEEEMREMEDGIEKKIPPAPLFQRGEEGNFTLVALAGTVTTLSAIKQKLTFWDGAKVQGSVLTISEIDALIDLFRKTTNQEKARLIGMVPGREDTILAGALILRAVMRKLAVPEVIVSDRGLRYGLLYNVPGP